MRYSQFLPILYKKLNDKNSDVGVNELAGALSISTDDLLKIPIDYQVVMIEKRSGGQRKLEIPCRELRTIQKRVYNLLLRGLSPHPCAMGFLIGKSIVHHASKHTAKAVIIKIDIKDFFPKTKSPKVEGFFLGIGWNKDAAKILTKLTTYRGHLPQGAPTSPCLSNLVNSRMDVGLFGIARKYRAEYSRYADDITFSLEIYDRRSVMRIIKKTKYVLKLLGYKLNPKKTRIFKSCQQQLVTGLVVNEKVQIPRKTRRLLRSIEHRFKQRDHSKLPTMNRSQLKGWKSFEQMIQNQSVDP